MRVLVVSDSHSALSFMFRCAWLVKPDAIIHLGDHYDDGEALRDEFPDARIYLVPGNCDRNRAPIYAQEILIQPLGGVRLYMTHGHRHRVKTGTGELLASARVAGCDAVLFGHTHVAECYQDDTGLWVLNPGSCGYFGGTAGLMEISDGKIRQCRILWEEDLSEFA